MKIKLSTNSGVFERNVIMDGFVATDYFTLSRNPLTGTEAATKQYVDNYPYSLSVSNISDGIIPIEMIGHSFKGDLRSTTPAYNALAPIGEAGSYTRYNVNAKGQIVSGIPATQDVITPSLSFNEISGVPKTAGQLITNLGPYVLPAAGASATLSNNLTLSREPTNNTEAATYRYGLSKMVAAGSAHKVGDIAIKPSTLTNATYLRANGAWLDKTTYATLYAAIGDRFNVPTGTVSPHMGKPWVHQSTFNTNQPSSLGFSYVGTVPGSACNSSVAITKNRLYIIGGDNRDNSVSAAVYSAPISADGTIGSWVAGPNLPVAISKSQVVLTNNKIYVLGGLTNGGMLSNVYYSNINPDGTLSGWLSGPSLPVVVCLGGAFATKGRVYFVGGISNGTRLSSVYSSTINPDGTLAGWQFYNSTTSVMKEVVLAVHAKRVYAYGNTSSFSSSPQRACTAVINDDGTISGWTSTSIIPMADPPYGDMLVSGNRMYVQSAGFIYYTQLDTNGNLTGNWYSSGGSLMYNNGSMAITSSKVYYIGGQDGNANRVNTVYASSFPGGRNDYVTLVTSSMYPVNQFKLPDLSSKKDGIYEYYIKATY